MLPVTPLVQPHPMCNISLYCTAWEYLFNGLWGLLRIVPPNDDVIIPLMSRIKILAAAIFLDLSNIYIAGQAKKSIVYGQITTSVAIGFLAIWKANESQRNWYDTSLLDRRSEGTATSCKLRVWVNQQPSIWPVLIKYCIDCLELAWAFLWYCLILEADLDQEYLTSIPCKQQILL